MDPMGWVEKGNLSKKEEFFELGLWNSQVFYSPKIESDDNKKNPHVQQEMHLHYLHSWFLDPGLNEHFEPKDKWSFVASSLIFLKIS